MKGGSLSLPLLSTKFNPPAFTGISIPRPRLLQCLDEGLEHNTSLLLVCGPAGYGKTTLVGDWLRNSILACTRHFVWLTLEGSDDELTRFLTYLIAALQRLQPEIGKGVLTMLRTHRPSPLQVLATLLVNELNEIPEPFLLVLDDFHNISLEPVHQLITFLVEHHPPQMTLVIVSRADPALPLARLRARRQLVELRQGDLCFTLEETSEFINRGMGLALTPVQLQVLEKRTEGWIAGLQLAALSMRNLHDRQAFLTAFSGEHEFIADYLADEVLASLPDQLRTFLMQISILDRCSGSLCDALTQQAGSQVLLEKIANDNLFLVPLDSHREWYRLHALFADLLRKRLQDAAASELPNLHRRAGRWSMENGQIDQAIQHALAAQDFEQAADWIEQIADRYLRFGEAVGLLRWMEMLPKDILMKRPYLGCMLGFTLFLCNREPKEVLLLLQEIGNFDEYQGEVATLQALVSILQGDVRQAFRFSEQAIALLPLDRPFFCILALDSQAMAQVMLGDMEAGAKAFEQVVEISIQTDNVMMTLMSLTNLAGLRYVHGQLRLAIASCNQVLDLASQRIGRQTPLVGKTLFNLGEILREQGDLQAGMKYLLEAAEMMEVFSEAGLPLVWLAIARINFNQNDWPAATANLVKARKYAQVSRTMLMDDRLVDLMQVRFWLWRGELHLVDEWVQERGLLGKSPAEVLAEAGKNVPVYEMFLVEIILLIRLALAHRQFDWVIEMVSLLLKPGEVKINRRRLLEILVLEGLAFDQAGKTDLALRTLGEALALAEPEGYQRIFIDEGQPLARLLYLCIEHKIFPGYAGRLLAAYSHEPSRTGLIRTPAEDELIEPLSGRELEVLVLIARGFTNHEVALRLSISLSTVKGHLTNIFDKLNVHNRTQAIARARSLGLLSSE